VLMFGRWGLIRRDYCIPKVVMSLSANWTFSLWCVPLIKSGSLNWPWSTKILGQFITSMRKNRLWYWKLLVSVLRQTQFNVTDKNNNASFEDLDMIISIITAHPVGLAAILAIMFLDLQNCRYSIFTYL
jgi:hypothetical protein